MKRWVPLLNQGRRGNQTCGLRVRSAHLTLLYICHYEVLAEGFALRKSPD
jgi:hypothetical protein